MNDNLLTAVDWDRLQLAIKQTEEESRHHEMQCKKMAQCVALLIQRAVYANGRKLTDAREGCGMARAALAQYLRLAYGDGYCIDEPLVKNAGDVLGALYELRDAEAAE